jgi:hypothetical protein
MTSIHNLLELLCTRLKTITGVNIIEALIFLPCLEKDGSTSHAESASTSAGVFQPAVNYRARANMHGKHWAAMHVQIIIMRI